MNDTNWTSLWWIHIIQKRSYLILINQWTWQDCQWLMSSPSENIDTNVWQSTEKNRLNQMKEKISSLRRQQMHSEFSHAPLEERERERGRERSGSDLSLADCHRRIPFYLRDELSMIYVDRQTGINRSCALFFLATFSRSLSLSLCFSFFSLFLFYLLSH